MSNEADPTIITWTKPMLARFRRRYAEAAAKQEDTFVFEGNQFVTNYAKYLIEYLGSQLR